MYRHLLSSCTCSRSLHRTPSHHQVGHGMWLNHQFLHVASTLFSWREPIIVSFPLPVSVIRLFLFCSTLWLRLGLEPSTNWAVCISMHTHISATALRLSTHLHMTLPAPCTHLYMFGCMDGSCYHDTNAMALVLEELRARIIIMPRHSHTRDMEPCLLSTGCFMKKMNHA